MKLYSGKIPTISKEIIRVLTQDGDIEVSNRDEAEMDIQSVLKEYLRIDRDLTEKTKDTLQARNLSHDQFGKVKKILAEEQGFVLGGEGISWMCSQILETFMQSQFVEEIFASDGDLRRKMKEVIRRHMMVDEELDHEVRERIKNLEEGTSNWEVEYAKVMDQVKRKKGVAVE